MRISATKNDPGHRIDAYNYRAYLDGKEMKDCFTADEDTGEAWVYVKENGELVLEDGELKVERLTGKVQIKYDEAFNI